MKGMRKAMFAGGLNVPMLKTKSGLRNRVQQQVYFVAIPPPIRVQHR